MAKRTVDERKVSSGRSAKAKKPALTKQTKRSKKKTVKVAASKERTGKAKSSVSSSSAASGRGTKASGRGTKASGRGTKKSSGSLRDSVSKKERVRRPQPQRTEPSRSFSKLTQSENEPESVPSASQLRKSVSSREAEVGKNPINLVGEAYRVVEENLRAGQEFAKNVAGKFPYGVPPAPSLNNISPEMMSAWIGGLSSMFGASQNTWMSMWQQMRPATTGENSVRNTSSRDAYVPEAQPPGSSMHPQERADYSGASSPESFTSSAESRNSSEPGQRSRSITIDDVQALGFGEFRGRTKEDGRSRSVVFKFDD